MSESHGTTNENLQEVNEAERRLRAIFDGAFEFIGLLKPDGTVLEANQTTLNYTGATAEEVIGRPFWETAWWTDSVEQQQRLKAAIAEAATGKFACFEAQHTAKDGTLDFIDFSLRPALDAAGQVAYLIPEGRRITERKRAEEALRESEEEFRALYESATVGMVQADLATGKLCRPNNELCQITGYSAEELLEKSFADITHPDDREANWEGFQSLVQGKVPEYHVEKRYIRKDGSVVWVRIGTRLIHDAEGRPTRSIATVEDITERKRAEEAGATLAAIVSSAADAIISTRNGIIQTWNKGAERLLGWSAAEAIGQDVTMLLPPTHLHKKWDIMARLDRGEAVPPYDTVRQRKDGSLVDVSFAISPVTLEGQVIGASATLRDITERKLTQAALSASEQRWRALLAAIPGMVFTVNADGENDFVNDHFYTYTGVSRDSDLRGKWVQSLHPDDREGAYARWMHSVQTGEPYENELRFRRHDGVYRWFHSRAVALRDEHGQIIKWAGSALDIEDIKQTQLALSESEERFRLLAENIDQVFWFVELEPERVIYVSPAIEQLWGLSADALYENPRLWLEKIHPEDRSNVKQAFEDWVTGQADTYDIQFRVLPKAGELRWTHDRGIVIGYKNGRPCKFSGIATDITERREADRRKDEFIATLAHELRNPLAPIRNVVSLLRLKGPLQPDVQRARDVISRQIDHLTRLIDDLLDVSRITSDKLELRKERVNLAEVVNLAVESSHPLIDQHRHKLSLLVPGEPIYLNADKIRLAQVIMNLLTNAAKYTPDEGRITLSAERNGEKVEVRVTDNGVGIAPNQLSNIFDMFYQANRSYEQLHGGLGIGLTLVRRLVEMHGGRVEAHSGGIDRGSEFVIRLPVLGEQSQTQEQTPSAEITRGTVQRILVVDDYGENAETLAELLRFDGYDVEIANDGIKAVEVAGKFRPSVVLLDIGMPKLNGYETARRIREQSWGKEMMLIAVTGWGQENDRNRSQQAGFSAHLLKPFDYPELVKLIADLSGGLTDA